MSMETLKTSATDLIAEGQKKAENAKEMREEVNRLIEGMSDVPEGLDDSVSSAIKAAQDQGTGIFKQDVEAVEQQALQDEAVAENIKGEVQEKINDNNTAAASLDALTSNKYGAGLESARNAIKENTDQGEAIKKEVDDRFKEIKEWITEAKSGI